METILLRKTSLLEAGLKRHHAVEYESAPSILKQKDQYSIEKLQATTEREPAIILALFELSFYERFLGGENRVNKDLYFKTDVFYNYEEVVSALFKKSVVSLVRLDDQERLYQVTVRGITQFGHAVIQSLQNIPQELQQLYCSEYQVDRESGEGLYALSLNSAEALHNISQAFKELIDCGDIKGIDISCLTLPQFRQNEVAKYLVTKYDEVYLNISIYPNTDIRLKRLIWK